MATAADELLASLGLMRKRGLWSSASPQLGWFAAGVVCGGCAALLLTPMSGDELMKEVETRMQHARDRIRKELRQRDRNNGSSHGSRAAEAGEA